MEFLQTLLVVDGMGSTRLLPGLILRPLGLTVIERANGQDALDLLSHVPIAVMLLDLQMPGLSGWDVLRFVRKDPRFREMRVFAYTAHAGREDVAHLIAQGFNGVLLKPFRSAELLQIIAK